MLPHLVKESSKLSRLVLQRTNLQPHHPLLLTNRSLFAREGAGESRNAIHEEAVRCYSQTAKRMNEDFQESEVAPTVATVFTKADKKAAARDYNSRRAGYRDQVSVIRKQYFDEIAKEREKEEALVNAEKEETMRRRLERQRLKNIRSARNALLEEEKRLNRETEFKEYLEVKQTERDERRRRYHKARAMVLAELEAEADLWLTTPEEVEAAFTHEAEQKLWARPNGVLGSPSPSVDSHFWQYESHTMHMDKTYKTPRELLLEELMEQIYEESTVDETFWTTERLRDQEHLEEKAKLRAMVRAHGRRALLDKQKEMLEKYFGTAEGEVPKRMPAPSCLTLS